MFITRIISFSAAVIIAATTLFIAQDGAHAPQNESGASIPQQTALTSRSGNPAAVAQPVPQTPAPTVLYEGIAEITAYTAQDDAGMDGRGITASGAQAVPYVTAAAWRGIPFGARVEVPELGASYIVQDRGGAIGFAHVDLYVGATNKQGAFDFGRKKLRIKIYAP